MIAGYDVPCVNCPPMYASKIGHLLCDNHALAATFWENKTERVYSLRSNEKGVDVSIIAEKFGGGGHRHAAGFKIPVHVNIELWDYQEHDD